MTTSFRNIRQYAKYCELEIRNGWKLRKVWGKKKTTCRAIRRFMSLYEIAILVTQK